MASKFWEDTALDDMNREQWEAICDGCAKCCLHKFIEDDDVDDFTPTDQPADDGHLHYTNIACYLLNDKQCACTAYLRRSELVPDCVTLTKENLDKIFFMPPSCSYRRLHEGKGLASWHPLLNKGKKSKMHLDGISVRNRTLNENDVNIADFEDYIVTWPLDEIE
ncbi:YcgN family cysteine cluster protein [Agaribacter marinus]|uniref:YcgN family cysteine cluster protein n=1 Tax=Agaribacter marinus TaxID=1431249 RepID=UPI0024E1543B|nr:YcgN family cysteine cluster protein [Agaribacter marinus]